MNDETLDLDELERRYFGADLTHWTGLRIEFDAEQARELLPPRPLGAGGPS